MNNRFLKIKYRGIPGYYDTHHQVIIGENTIFDMLIYIAVWLDEQVFKFDFPEIEFIN